MSKQQIYSRNMKEEHVKLSKIDIVQETNKLTTFSNTHIYIIYSSN